MGNVKNLLVAGGLAAGVAAGTGCTKETITTTTTTTDTTGVPGGDTTTTPPVNPKDMGHHVYGHSWGEMYKKQDDQAGSKALIEKVNGTVVVEPAYFQPDTMMPKNAAARINVSGVDVTNSYQQNTIIDALKNIPGAYLKDTTSFAHHNGMKLFDLTNPDVYKAVVKFGVDAAKTFPNGIVLQGLENSLYWDNTHSNPALRDAAAAVVKEICAQAHALNKDVVLGDCFYMDKSTDVLVELVKATIINGSAHIAFRQPKTDIKAADTGFIERRMTEVANAAGVGVPVEFYLTNNVKDLTPETVKQWADLYNRIAQNVITKTGHSVRVNLFNATDPQYLDISDLDGQHAGLYGFSGKPKEEVESTMAYYPGANPDAPGGKFFVQVGDAKLEDRLAQASVSRGPQTSM